MGHLYQRRPPPAARPASALSLLLLALLPLSAPAAAEVQATSTALLSGQRQGPLTIAIVVLPAKGHITPLTALAWELADRGHNVTFIVPDTPTMTTWLGNDLDYTPTTATAYPSSDAAPGPTSQHGSQQASQHGSITVIRSSCCPDWHNSSVEAFSKFSGAMDVDPWDVFLQINEIFALLEHIVAPMYRDILPLLTALKPDVLVSDIATSVAPFLATQLSVPLYVSNPIAYSAPVQTFDFNHPFWGSPFTVPMTLRQKLFNAFVIGVARGPPGVNPGLIEFNRQLSEELGLPKLKGRLLPWDGAFFAHQSSPLLEPPRAIGPLEMYVGPVIRSRLSPLPEELQAWLDARAPTPAAAEAAAPGSGAYDGHGTGGVILVAFGTTVSPPSDVLEVLFAGLEAAAERHGMWVLMATSFVPWDSPAVVAYRGRPRFRFEKWIPQAQVLRHPSVLLMVNSGGANSVHETLAAGVPMLLMPFICDQKLMTARLVKTGFATLLTRGPDGTGFTPATVAKAVTDLTRSQPVRQAARRMSCLHSFLGGAPRAAQAVEMVAALGVEGLHSMRQYVLDLPLYTRSNLDLVLAVLGVLGVLAAAVLAALWAAWKLAWAVGPALLAAGGTAAESKVKRA